MSKLKSLGSANVVAAVEAILDSLQRLQVVIPEPAAVRDYLADYPDMADLLLSVCEVTRRRSGDDTQLSLEVYRDPEIDDKYLTLCIRQREYDEDILGKIKSIWAEYEDKLVGRSGCILVTTDFDPPR